MFNDTFSLMMKMMNDDFIDDEDNSEDDSGLSSMYNSCANLSQTLLLIQSIELVYYFLYTFPPSYTPFGSHCFLCLIVPSIFIWI